MKRLLQLTELLLSKSDKPADEPPREPTDEEIAEARAFLDANDSPLPECWAFERFSLENGGYVRVGRAVPEESRATLFFVPGYTSSQELASEFLGHWFGLGFEIIAMDLPGQGGSMRREDDYQKPYTGDWSFYGRSVTEVVKHAKATRKGQGPFVVVGESMGAHCVLRAAHDDGLKEADGILVMVPAILPMTRVTPIWLGKRVTSYAVNAGKGHDYFPGEKPWFPGKFDAQYYKNYVREDRTFKNEALFRLRPDLRVGGTTVEYVHGLMVSGQELLNSTTLPKLDIPVTMLTAGKEVYVQNQAAEKICNDVLGTCELVRLKEATHCLHLDPVPIQMKVHETLLSLVSRAEKRMERVNSLVH